MNAIKQWQFYWLLKREYLESRGGFVWAQVYAAGVILLITILGIITGEVFRARSGGEINFSNGAANIGELLRSASASDLSKLAMGLNYTLLSFGVIASVVLFFVVFFYLLGALYDDRRDRSILFWKSLPISDTATVLSKVAMAVVLAPLAALLVTLAGFVCLQVILSLWLLVYGVNPFGLLWMHAQPLELWLRLLVSIPINAVWALPTVGWLLLWSALARSKPFLWAVAVPLAAGVINGWIGLLGLPNIDNLYYWTQLVGRALVGVMPEGWMAVNTASMHGPEHLFIGADQMTAISYSAMAHAMTLPSMWVGAAVGVVFIAASIWIRRWRADV